jgi:hypothetical protein
VAKPKPILSRAASVAAFWRVHLRTAQRWLAEPGRAASPPTPPLAAIDDPAAMLAWFAALPSASQAKSTPTFRARIDAFRIALDRGQPLPRVDGAPSTPTHPSGAFPSSTPAATPSSPDTDYATFLHDRAAATAAPGSTARTTGPLEKLKLQRDYALHQIELGNRRRDPALVKDATDTLKRLHDAIYDEETLNARLGRDLGDIIPRADYERQLKALAFWLVRTVDDAKATLAPRLAAASATGPLFRQEVDAILEPVLLTTRVLDPLRRSADLPPGTGAALPPWALNALRTALASCLEDANPEQAKRVEGLAPSQISNPPISVSQISNPQISDSEKRVTEALSAPPPEASAAPSVSGRDGPKPAGEATASHSPLGSVPAQTA